MRRGRVLAGAMLLLAMATTTAEAQGRRDDGNWEKLGCVDVGRRPDWDIISVGRREGRFKAIRVEAAGNSVSLLDLKVVYANGDPDRIPVRSELHEGESTRPLDLIGRERAIDRIEIVSKKDFRGPGRGRAAVCVFALAANDGPRGDYGGGGGGGGGRSNWEELGCQSVGFLVDRDVIRVGRREGRFKAIKLTVGGNRVHILDLKVIYANGEPDDIPVRAEIREGGETRPLDLRGFDRSIDRVELVYRAPPNFRGKARVCLQGLQ